MTDLRLFSPGSSISISKKHELNLIGCARLRASTDVICSLGYPLSTSHKLISFEGFLMSTFKCHDLLATSKLLLNTVSPSVDESVRFFKASPSVRSNSSEKVGSEIDSVSAWPSECEYTLNEGPCYYLKVDLVGFESSEGYCSLA